MRPLRRSRHHARFAEPSPSQLRPQLGSGQPSRPLHSQVPTEATPSTSCFSSLFFSRSGTQALTQALRYSGTQAQTLRHSDTLRRSDVLDTLRHSDTHTLRYSDTQILRHSDTQIRSDAQTLRYSDPLRYSSCFSSLFFSRAPVCSLYRAARIHSAQRRGRSAALRLYLRTAGRS